MAPVAEGFEALPYGDLLCCCELIKTIGFNGFQESVKRRGVCRGLHPADCASVAPLLIPEFHTNILFEPVFDDNPFSHK